MKLLLDTHAFLWWIRDDESLGARARKTIANDRNHCFLSMASCWEMAIKKSLGKLEIPEPVDAFVAEQLAANRFTLLSIDLRHVSHVSRLAFHHRDPFDRLMVAQAREEGLAIASADPIFHKYGIERVW
ncbi:MAG: type II toxin-antitoxin system VapC family toxin [Acidobacteriota bacterium]|nr:type II toxin-antitoxin system VapC family toxin [Acidobacteriota bacterium]